MSEPLKAATISATAMQARWNDPSWKESLLAEAYATLEWKPRNCDLGFDDGDGLMKLTVFVRRAADKDIYQNSIMFSGPPEARDELSEETLRRFGEEVVADLARFICRRKGREVE